MRGKSFTLKKLHAEEVNLAGIRLGGVNLVDQADIGVAHFERAFQFWRQQALEAGLSRLNRYAQIAFAVDGFVNNAHPALADDAHDLETAFNDFARTKPPAHQG